MNEQSIDLRGMFGVFRRRFKFILGFVFAILTLTTIVLFTLTPRYTATSKLLLDVTGKNLFDPDASVPSTALANAIIDTEVELILSTQVLMKTFSDLNLIETNEYGGSPTFVDRVSRLINSGFEGRQGDGGRIVEIFDRFRDRVEVKRQGFTFIINVSAIAESPQLASQIANKITSTHIALKRQSKDATAVQAQRLFQERIAATQAIKAAAQERLEAFIPENLDELVQLDKDAQIPVLRSQFVDLEEQSKARSKIIAALKHDIKQMDQIVLNSQYLSDGLKTLMRQRREIASQIDSNNDAEGTLALRDKLASIDQQLVELIADDLNRLKREEQADANRLSAVRNELTARVVQIAPATTISQLDALRVDANVSSDLYQRLVKRGSELQVQTDIQVSDVRITQEASPPLFPSFPNKVLVLTLACISSLGAAIALAFVFDQHWGGINSEGQLADVISKRVGAVVPSHYIADALEGDRYNISAVMDFAPASNFAEAIRRVRSEIDLSNIAKNADKSGKVILVTSCVASEGKSTIAIALAKSIANSGSRVILIDGDIRKPVLHNYLATEGDGGLVSFLQNPVNVQALAASFRKQVVPNLDLLVGRSQINQPSDVFGASVGFDRLIASVSATYDFVIIDTPPLLPVVDTSYLLHYADVAVFVVGYAKTSQHEVRKADALLEKYLKPNALLLPVLNRTDPSASGYS